jgi:hypothetical protein
MMACTGVTSKPTEGCGTALGVKLLNEVTFHGPEIEGSPAVSSVMETEGFKVS